MFLNLFIKSFVCVHSYILDDYTNLYGNKINVRREIRYHYWNYHQEYRYEQRIFKTS